MWLKQPYTLSVYSISTAHLVYNSKEGVVVEIDKEFLSVLATRICPEIRWSVSQWINVVRH